MKNRLIIRVFLSMLLTFILYPPLHAEENNLNDFIGQIQNSLIQKDVVHQGPLSQERNAKHSYFHQSSDFGT